MYVIYIYNIYIYIYQTLELHIQVKMLPSRVVKIVPACFSLAESLLATTKLAPNFVVSQRSKRKIP